RVAGPEQERRSAMDALEMIADNFLSVSTPVQAALPDLLRIGTSIRARIQERILSNLQTLRQAAAGAPSISALPVEAGWSAVLRIPATRSDEDTVLALLDRGVLLQPGYFFDFPADGYLVVSLLTPPDQFAEGIRRTLEVIG
ncbi:MAG TPA: pyridoxal phosphate-dependent aminotransferase, partial [Thermoanaerobaculia bacterium]|nr:pyridoxal phosphate-dependent aminotransferase [Thermoanaerobaculia bacterium]